MSTTLEQNQYGFDRASRRTWQKRPLTTMQDQQYNYDTLSQVAAAARGSLNLNATAISGIPASAESWDYDPTGNWLGYHAAASGTSTLDQHRVHDRGNRMTQIEDNPSNMLLDRVGRMRQMAPDASGDWDGKLEITWDAWSRITSVKNNGEVAGEYSYDGTYRRITRAVDGVTLHSYYNDTWRPVEERQDSATTASISYLWGVRFRDDLARRDRAVGGTTLNETRYILMDYFNPAAITDEAGTVKERYAFSAFGLRTIMNSDYTERSSSECGLEFAFQGQFLDGESGLMNYGYRYYSPQLGRWTCKDPIEEAGGGNLYQMVDNNAINYVDKYGLLEAGVGYGASGGGHFVLIGVEVSVGAMITTKCRVCISAGVTVILGPGLGFHGGVGPTGAGSTGTLDGPSVSAGGGAWIATPFGGGSFSGEVGATPSGAPGQVDLTGGGGGSFKGEAGAGAALGVRLTVSCTGCADITGDYFSAVSAPIEATEQLYECIKKNVSYLISLI